MEQTSRPWHPGRTRGEGTDGRGSVQSVERTLDLFELLVNAGGEVGMRDIGARTGIPVATVHRLLNVLVRRGYVRRDAATRRYGLGYAALELSTRIRSQGGLRQRAQPYLRELVLLTSETANLGVLESGQATYIAQVEAPRMVRMFTEIGNRVPPHACGMGKVLFAFLPGDEREALLLQLALTRYTAATITDRDRVRLELSKIREQGYAIDEGEFEEGVRCVAVPVLDRARLALAALSVSGPGGRFTRERIDAWIPRMRSIAADLSQALQADPV